MYDSVKAVRENLIALKPLLPRIMELLKTPKDEGLFSSHGKHAAASAPPTPMAGMK
jgi:hypothetical protein